MSNFLRWCGAGIRPLLILGVLGLVLWATTISSAYQMRLFLRLDTGPTTFSVSWN